MSEADEWKKLYYKLKSVAIDLEQQRDSLRSENARLRAAHGHQQQEISVMRDREIAAGCVDDYMSQAEQLDKLRQENERLREACVKTNDEICQTLGKALGYPWYKDDPENFPDATEENGVCTGDHVAESIAMEAARIIGELRSENERLRKDAERLDWLRKNFKELDYWAVMRTGRHDINAAIDAAKEAE